MTLPPIWPGTPTIRRHLGHFPGSPHLGGFAHGYRAAVYPPCALPQPRTAPRPADAHKYPSTCPVSFCAHPRQRQPSLHTLTATIPAWAPVPPRPGGHSVPPVPGTALTPDHAALTVQGAVRAGVPMLRGGHTGHSAELCVPGCGQGGSAGVWGVREGGCGALISSAPGSCGEFQEPGGA